MAREFKRPTPIQFEKILPELDMMEHSKYPPHWELNAVPLAIQEINRIGKEYVHISNLSSVNAVYAIRKAKKQNPNLKLTCETSGKNVDTRFKIAPPIRNDQNRRYCHILSQTCQSLPQVLGERRLSKNCQRS